VINLAITWEFVPKFSVFANIQNLTNAKYCHIGGRAEKSAKNEGLYGAMQPPIRIIGGLKFNW